MSMRAKLIANLQGRAASYWLNAQADAGLAQQIIKHLNNKALPTPPNNRFDALLNCDREAKEPDAFLACCAFALWEINGRMDYEVAMFYAKLSGFSTHLPPNYYETDPPTPFPLVSSWTLPLLNNQRGLRRFLERHHCGIRDANSRTFRRAIRAVQEINITHNLEIIASFSKTSSNKVEQLREMLRHSTDPDEFMRSAQNTQRMAIFWDQLYINLIKFVNKLTTTLSG